MAELDAGRPILYFVRDDNGMGAHSFICDGYNAEGLFHFNLGWYGISDGWYVTTALNLPNRYGEDLYFNTENRMIIGVEPPAPPTPIIPGDVNSDDNVSIDDITALISYLLNGTTTGIDLVAVDVNENGTVDIDDVTALIVLLLSSNYNG